MAPTQAVVCYHEILSAQANQIIAIVPYGTYSKTSAQMDVEYNGGRSAYMTVPVADSAPGIFSNVLNADGSVNSASNPAKKGTYITFYSTGEGIPQQTLGIDGRLAVATPYQTPFLSATVTLNGAAVTPMYAGAAPNNAGIMQVTDRGCRPSRQRSSCRRLARSASRPRRYPARRRS